MRVLHVMVVEDDGMIALAISDILAQIGHQVCGIASTQSDAVAMCGRSHPDLIVIDCHLRVGSGILAMREILAQGFVPHVYITGDSLVAGSLERDAVVLRKPFSEPDLVDSIARALTTMPLI